MKTLSEQTRLISKPELQKRLKCVIRDYFVNPAQWRARRAGRKLKGVIPLLLRGRIGQTVRYQLIKVTRSAPLELTVARGNTVVQVGAVGDGELWDMVRLVGQGGRVIVIEPFPDNVRAIEERLIKEAIRNVTVVPKGAWSVPGKQKLYIHPKWSASNIVLDSGTKHDRAMRPENYAGAVEIEVDRLDDILASQGIDKCDFIKITVMGAEIHVLKGMNRLLNGNPTVWVKAHSMIDGQPANGEISKMFNERGFRTVITRGNLGPDGLIRPGDVYAMRKEF
jgi:FkbM family methyltransferase